MQKSKIKKMVILIAVIIIPIVGLQAYSLLNQFMPRKKGNPQSVNRIKSSDTRSSVFVHGNTDGTDKGFQELIHLMAEKDQDFYEIIGKEDVIILKVNSQWDERGGTNVDLTESVIAAIIDHPAGFDGEIIIADNGQDQFGSENSGGSMNWNRSNGQDKSRSMQDLADSYKSLGHKVSTYSWDTITGNKVNEFDSGDMNEGFVVANRKNEDSKITVSYPKFISRSQTCISFKKGIWNKNSQSYDYNKLKIINMPVLKTHMQYGVTGAVKGYMGVPSEKLTRNSHSTIGIGSMGTLMAETRMPDLNIMDAIYINANTDRSGRGPSTDYNEAAFTKTILVSTDPVALDYYAAGEVLYPAIKESGDEIQQLHDRDSLVPGSFGYWLRLSLGQIRKYGYDAVIDADKIDVFSYSIDS